MALRGDSICIYRYNCLVDAPMSKRLKLGLSFNSMLVESNLGLYLIFCDLLYTMKERQHIHHHQKEIYQTYTENEKTKIYANISKIYKDIQNTKLVYTHTH